MVKLLQFLERFKKVLTVQCAFEIACLLTIQLQNIIKNTKYFISSMPNKY